MTPEAQTATELYEFLAKHGKRTVTYAALNKILADHIDHIVKPQAEMIRELKAANKALSERVLELEADRAERVEVQP